MIKGNSQLDWIDNDHFYYNATQISSGLFPVAANISDQRNVPFVLNPTEWQVAVERFDISSASVPFFYYDVVNNPFIINLIQNVAVDPNIVSQTVNPPYNLENTLDSVNDGDGIFSIKQLLGMINQSIYILCRQMNTLIPGSFPNITGNVGGPNVNQPYFLWDSTVNKIMIYWPMEDNPSLNPPLLNNMVWNEVTPQTSSQNVYFILTFNNALAQLFLGMFNAEYYGENNTLVAQGIQVPGAFSPHSSLVFKPQGNLNAYSDFYGTSGSHTTWLEIAQKTGIYQWNAVNKIYMKTDLPIREEVLPGNGATSNILCDFGFIASENFTGYSRFQYSNMGNLKWVDLLGTQPFSSIKVSFFYQTYAGKSYQIMLNRTQELSYKLIFRRKKKLPT